MDKKNYPRRDFIRDVSVTGIGSMLLQSCHVPQAATSVSKDLSEQMYNKALQIARSKVRGGPSDPVFKKPFVDAAFSNNIFYWDTCFIAAYAKYHQDQLPILNALDNFYNLMEPDGFICREYTREGKPMWPKEHPVSVNPPLLAFAELELFSVHKDLSRLKKAYPILKKHFDHWISNWSGVDHLFFNDALGSGMDNIERFPQGWTDDQQGIRIHNLHPEIFEYGGLDSAWNRQGRMVDTSSQMVLFAKNLMQVGELIDNSSDKSYLQAFIDETIEAINQDCWDEGDGFYYDLGYGKQIRRKHIGAFWTLLAGVVPKEKTERFLAHLTNPDEFWRKIPVATTSAGEKEFSPDGDYWRGSVWAPTNYMVLRGLKEYRKHSIASRLAHSYYWAVAEVFKKTNTFWENYAPDRLDRGNNSRPDFCGWTGIVPIAIYNEWIK
jgi:hypothetical protein